MSKLILASTSIYRKKQLKRIIQEFQLVAPQIDEDDFKNHITVPELLVETLAEEKASTILKQFPDSVIIGADQVASFEGEVLGKPGSYEKAHEQIQKLQGHKHHLLTSICILSKFRKEIYTDNTTLFMKNLSNDQISNYLKLDKPYDCAGSYKIEEHGINLFEKIESQDQSAIIGLPLIKLSLLLEEFGFVCFES